MALAKALGKFAGASLIGLDLQTTPTPSSFLHPQARPKVHDAGVDWDQSE